MLIRQTAFTALLGALCLCLAAQPAAAQEKGDKKSGKKAGARASGAAQKKWAAVMKIRKRIQEVAQELQKIQKEVVKKQPELVSQQKALRRMVAKGMKKQGVDEEQGMAELMALRGMLSNGDISDEKKKQIRAKLKKKAMALKAAHDKATADPKVKKAQEAFRKAMEAAMMKTEPRARKLLEEFYKLRKQLKDLLPPMPK